MSFGFSTGHSADEAFHLLTETPTGFTVITNPHAGRIAIGTLNYDNKRGADVVILTLEKFKPIPLHVARQRIVDRINQVRLLNGAPPLVISNKLSVAAQDAADGVRSGQLKWKHASEQLMHRVADERLASGQMSVSGHTVKRLAELDVSQDTSISDSSLRFLGIGVAQGPLLNGGSPHNVVICVLAEGPGDQLRFPCSKHVYCARMNGCSSK